MNNGDFSNPPTSAQRVGLRIRISGNACYEICCSAVDNNELGSIWVRYVDSSSMATNWVYVGKATLSAPLGISNLIAKAQRITDKTGPTRDDWWYKVDCGVMQFACEIEGGYSWTPQLWYRHTINGNMSAWVKVYG